MIDQIRGVIRHELFYAQASRDFWWRCIGENERRVEILEVLNDHVGFFGIAVQQFFESYVVAILRLYDSDKRSVTLKHFFREMKASGSLTPSEIERLDDLFAKAEPISRS
ncbi:MAG: hypothetical protein ACSHX7_12250 [Luteolibacter sp.]